MTCFFKETKQDSITVGFPLCPIHGEPRKNNADGLGGGFKIGSRIQLLSLPQPSPVTLRGWLRCSVVQSPHSSDGNCSQGCCEEYIKQCMLRAVNSAWHTGNS